MFASTAQTEIVVTNLSPSVTERDLLELFGRYGRIVSVRTFGAQGIARITFLDPQDAADAVVALDEREIHGQRIEIAPSTPLREETRARRYLLVDEAGALIRSGEIIHSSIDPENQREVPPGLTRVTLMGIDGQEYDVLSRYNPITGMIYPPG